MTLFVVLVILSAALLHAVWNAIVKTAADRTTMLGLVALGQVLPAAVMVMVLPLPSNLLDLLIVANISTAVLILLVVQRASSRLEPTAADRWLGWTLTAIGLLVATGYSICGASAVAAMQPLSDADERRDQCYS